MSSWCNNSLKAGVLGFMLAAAHDVPVPLHGPTLNGGTVSERLDAVLWVKGIALACQAPVQTKCRRKVEHTFADLHKELHATV